MQSRICQTCGVRFPPASSFPECCPICRDERRHRTSDRQKWTDFDQMREEGFRNIITEIETDLFEIVTEPSFAAGQRSLLACTKHGNVLWDCVSHLDSATVAVVKALGGVAAIAISHPHFYGAMIAWSEAFGHVPIWLAGADRKWIPEDDSAIRFYRNEQELLPGISAIRCGGHFPGSAVLHFATGSEGKGALLVSDTVAVLPDRHRVSFMHSRSDLLPLPARQVQAILKRLKPLEFERIYGGWAEENILADGKNVFLVSADRFVRKTEGEDEAAWKATIL